jgi:UPF0755 protein
MSSSSKVKLFLFIIIATILIGGSVFAYTAWNSYPTNFANKQYVLQSQESSTLTTFAAKLEKDGIISNKEVFLLKAKIQKTDPLQLGDYAITVPASAEDILKQIDAISLTKVEEVKKLASRPTSQVTFKEGLTLDQMFDILEQKEVVTKSELIKFATEPANAKKFNYIFLPSQLDCAYGNLKNCAKYYFEGYLYPDTYKFFKNSTPEDVFSKMLANFDTKVWQKITNKPDQNKFYKVMTLASVIEKESGRTKGVTSGNRAELQSERKNIAGALINRVEKGMKWQSDVTATYGHGFDICQQTFKVKDCIFLDDPLAQTKYNTYNIKNYPIGPISNPDLDNITAALTPESNDYIYFVADVTGKVYFAADDFGHTQNIEKVKQINRDLGL